MLLSRLTRKKNIGRCIDSVRTVADEVVVVDSFSSDKTEEIAKAKGARFIQHRFEGHSEQKNFAKEQTAYDFILSIDADETLSEELEQSILEREGFKPPMYLVKSMNISWANLQTRKARMAVSSIRLHLL